MKKWTISPDRTPGSSLPRQDWSITCEGLDPDDDRREYPCHEAPR